MTFEHILEHTLREEGGWSDHSADTGGKTQMGITQGTLSAWLGRPATDDEIQNLTRDQAIEIYRVMYFERPRINLLQEALWPVVFDFGVNAGPGRSVMTLQRTINQLNAVPDVTVDGGIGPRTIDATQVTLFQVGDVRFVNSFCDHRQQFYLDCVSARPSQAVFLAGWTSRCNRFRLKS